MSAEDAKEAARARIAELVAAFKKNEADYLSAGYNETQARTDFITPLLEAFGWDVHNVKGHSLALREVIEEATVEVGEEGLSKRPDYELRLARQRKLFVEAKKPSVRLDKDAAPAFQCRRYGYSASLPISVVTNFHQIAIYDCRPIPAETDAAHVARLHIFSYEEFDEKFDVIWPILSRESVYAGEFDKLFDVDTTRYGSEQFDDLFLSQVRSWRERLAVDIHKNTPSLTAEELTYAVQLFLSRIVFLRICEDREIEKYETLKGLGTDGAFEGLLDILRRADEFYNSGLFRLIDDEPLGVRISDETLASIITELYYPQSPYTFSVVETEVLGEIYEQFLGEIITIDGSNVEVVRKPEVRESGGIVPTPRFVADTIVERTLAPKLAGKSPAELEQFTVADICCGSGTLLLSAFDRLLEHYLEWYLAHEPDAHVGHRIYQAGPNLWRLTFEEKRRILLAHIRGVDIDQNAVEVTQFSLLLKLVENENAGVLKDYVKRAGEPALPSLDETIKCGNSLVSSDEWSAACGAMTAGQRQSVNPFTWEDEFPAEMARGGFDVIVDNPPYIRIQNMVAYSPDEVAYYQNENSPYATANQDNFDKYGLFVERALSLVRQQGRVGVIIPHKFMSIQAGKALRSLVSEGQKIAEVVHFGAKQVFGKGTSNYTAIVVLDRSGVDPVKVEKVEVLETWRYGQPGVVTDIPAGEFGEDPWDFADADTRALFAKVRGACAETLDSVAEILVGVQTSADKIYIIHSDNENATSVVHRWDGRDWNIEKGILRPCLHDVQLQAYLQPQTNSWIIFPYEIVNDGGAPRARLLQPNEIQAQFPGCWDYLVARREKLEERNIVGGAVAERQWYQYGRSQSLTKFNTPKIILPVLSLEPRYAYDVSNAVFTGGGNGPYYMVRPREGSPVSDFFLLALLNHPFSEAITRTNTSVFRGGYYSHGKQFIENLPVPVPDAKTAQEIDAMVGKLISVLSEFVAVKTPPAKRKKFREANELRRSICVRMDQVLGLSKSDIETVIAVPIPD